VHYVTKTYGHEAGLSACFRQWRATSHCRFLHGYPLSFEFKFAADELDENGWVINFGALKPVKAWLEAKFDHKLLVAEDDPELNNLVALSDKEVGLAQVIVVERVGCEAFAEMAYRFVMNDFLLQADYMERNVRLVSVTVREHAGNGVIYQPE
jgi:6-pyruvoyltetrahydropterin/6-carboxytetrahydropterin synthase